MEVKVDDITESVSNLRIEPAETPVASDKTIIELLVGV
jgi:hypothetical protein